MAVNDSLTIFRILSTVALLTQLVAVCYVFGLTKYVVSHGMLHGFHKYVVYFFNTAALLLWLYTLNLCAGLRAFIMILPIILAIIIYAVSRWE